MKLNDFNWERGACEAQLMQKPKKEYKKLKFAKFADMLSNGNII